MLHLTMHFASLLSQLVHRLPFFDSLDHSSLIDVQVMGLSGPEMRDYVEDLRSRVWGKHRDVSLMPADMRETCATLEADMRDIQLRAAAAPEPASCSAQGGDRSQRQGAEGMYTREAVPEALPITAAGVAGFDKERVKPDSAASPGAELALEIDRSGDTGGDFYVLWSGSKPEMHPSCAAVVLACASYAWLLPAYLQSLVADLEAAMLDSETSMGRV